MPLREPVALGVLARLGKWNILRSRRRGILVALLEWESLGGGNGVGSPRSAGNVAMKSIAARAASRLSDAGRGEIFFAWLRYLDGL